ncbi:helix-turn-helix transcriptional regulator [Nocardia sp. NPDC005745]|uniref:helix-turn-helix domain-containing protein n=1 Tax=Actinomycetes TaxID=1760 RepID=UPI0033FDA8D6
MRLKSSDTLRALMHQSGLSTRGLAAQVGCDHSFIDHLLAGRRLGAGHELASEISRAVGAPEDLLWDGDSA